MDRLTAKSTARFVGSGAISFALKLSHTGLQFGLSILLARNLSADEFGAYSFAMALCGVCVVFAHFGIPTNTMRVTARHSELSKSHVHVALTAVIATSLFVCVTAALALLVVPIEAALVNPTLASLIMIIPLGIVYVSDGIMRARGSIFLGLLPEQLVRPLTTIGLIALSMLLVPVSATVAVTAHSVAAILVCFYSYLQVNSRSSGDFALNKSSLSRSVRLAKQSWSYFLLAGAQVVNYQVGTIAVGVMSASSAAGAYRIAVQVAQGASIVLVAVAAVLGPSLARISRSPNTVFKYTVFAGIASSLLLVIPSVVLLFNSELFVKFIFGSEHIGAAAPLSVLMVGKVFYAVAAFSGLALSMLGKPKIAAAWTLSTCLLNVFLCAALIPKWGAVGAAYSSIAASLFCNFGMLTNLYFISRACERG